MDQVAISSFSSSSVQKNLKRKGGSGCSTTKKQAANKNNKDELKVVLVTGGKWVPYDHPYEHAAQKYEGDSIMKHDLTLCRKNITLKYLKNQISSLGVSMDLKNIRLTYVVHVRMAFGETRKQDLTVTISHRDINVLFFLNSVDRGYAKKPVAIYHEPYDWRANHPGYDPTNPPPLIFPEGFNPVPAPIVEPVAKEVEVVLYSGGSWSGFYPHPSHKKYKGDSVVKHSFMLPLKKLTWNKLKNRVRALGLPMDNTFMISCFRGFLIVDKDVEIRLDMKSDEYVRRFLEVVDHLPKPVLMYHCKQDELRQRLKKNKKTPRRL